MGFRCLGCCFSRFWVCLFVVVLGFMFFHYGLRILGCNNVFLVSGSRVLEFVVCLFVWLFFVFVDQFLE